jgi:hypothetical protein
MKKILLSAAVLTLASGAFAQKKVADVAKFDSETINLGKIKQGTPTKGTFVITNIGKDPLVIEQANPTCGCTISNFTKEPIPAGKTGNINATYNGANVGHFDKHLTVKIAGIDEIKSITLTGDVLSTEEYAKWETENAAKIKSDEAAKAEAAKAAAKPVKKSKKKAKTAAKTAVVNAADSTK